MMEEELIEEVKKILMDDYVNRLVNEKVAEFINNRFSDEKKWFIELSYCILTANTSAKSSLKCIEALTKRDIIFYGSLNEIEKILRDVGYRYPRKRAEYIVKARERMKEVKKVVERYDDDLKRRDWLRRNIIGLGMKESSHFLRNIGFFNYAIIDRHILNILLKYRITSIDQRKINVRKYLELENIIKRLSMKIGLKPGILDLYIWYMDTGEVLK
ncbi:MAG: N-glycosylase/DNA lyase [Candidatus Methanomethylicia archaeon]